MWNTDVVGNYSRNKDYITLDLSYQLKQLTSCPLTPEMDQEMMYDFLPDEGGYSIDYAGDITPPLTPEHPFPEELTFKVKSNNSWDDDDDSNVLIGGKDPWLDCSFLQESGLAKHGISLKKEESSADATPEFKRLSDLDITKCNHMVFRAVSPSSVFPQMFPSPADQPKRNTSQGTESFRQSDTDITLDTPSASSEDEEIDVVNDEMDQIHHQQASRNRLVDNMLDQVSKKVPRLKLNIAKSNNNNSSKRHQTWIVSTKSTPSNTLPAAQSVSAQVAAMHNYSSTVAQPRSSSGHQYKLATSYSAPSTPSSALHHHLTSGHSKSSRRPHPYSISSPSSPQLSYSQLKRQRAMGEADLKAVARKLHSGKRTKYTSSHQQHSPLGSRSSSDVEEPNEQGKRAYHNVLERKRRNDLRKKYHTLRDYVPEICTNDRAPKMVILNKAVEHINQLELQYEQGIAERNRLKHLNERLNEKFSFLKNFV